MTASTQPAPGGPGVEIRELVQQLARAEQALAAAMGGKVDSVLDPEGQSYLLREAQQALLRSEAEARERAAMLEAIFEHAPELVAFLDRQGQVRFPDRSAAAPSPTITWLRQQLREQPPALRRSVEAVLAGGRAITWESPGDARGPEGARHASWSLGPVVEDGAVVGVVAIGREVTAQRVAEAQLLDSDRMAAVGTLAAGVAHEINNPLSVVIAGLELALRDRAGGEPPEELREALVDARDAAERVRLIVRDLKVFSRSGDEPPVAVDVEPVLDATLRMAENELRHRARLERRYARVPPVLANESRLSQVFLNLVVNAAQAIEEGHAEDHLVRVSTELDARGRVLVRVSDTGQGIAPEIRARLFTPFFTTKPVGTGTGLGLSISRRIVTALGGELTFQSEVGRGTEFLVALPVAELPVREPARPQVEAATRRGRVLVVDDEAAIANLARRMLCADHEVVALTDSLAALRAFQEGERFDAVLCDVMIPQLTGLDLYLEVAALDPAQARRFVFMTGGLFTARARQFLVDCPNPQLEKPFDASRLRGAVNRMVNLGG